MIARRLSAAARWRWHVAARLLTAIAGGYALTALASARLAAACTLIMARPDAALTGMLLSFALYAMIIVWSLGPASIWRVWKGLLLLTGLLLALGLLLPSSG